MNSENTSEVDGMMISAPPGKCLYAWNQSSGRWVSIGPPSCSSGMTCPHSSDVQTRLSGYPTSGQYPLSCVSAPSTKEGPKTSYPKPQESARGPVYSITAGSCTYAWSSAESRWVVVASGCSSGMTCPHSSDARQLLYGLPIGGHYLISCVSAPGIEERRAGEGGCCG